MSDRKCQHRKALELFSKVGVKITPEEIDKHVGGTGSYFSKHISVLRRWGFVFDVEKEGRNIVSFTLKSEPSDAANYRNSKTKDTKKVSKKTTKVLSQKKPTNKKKVIKSAPKVPLDVKASNKEKMKEVLEKRKAVKKELAKEPALSSVSVDPDWDATDDIDIASLV